MSLFSTLLFAVTREDHLVEAHIIEQFRPGRMLTICSGGCVPLSLKALYSYLSITAFDLNPYQFSHVKKKIMAVNVSDFDALNIGKQNDTSLNQAGEFEQMFQRLRESFIQKVSGNDNLEIFFNNTTSNKKRRFLTQAWQKHANIRKPFADVFNDTSIEAVFSDQATKQGIPGTYIKYFQKKIMDEFQKTDSYLNPFLQHVFQGYYSSEAAFPYMTPGFNQELEFIEGTLYDVPDISSYNFVSLSNLFDWSEIEFVEKCADYLSQLKAGSPVLLRQLNNHKDWIDIFKTHFKEDKSFDSYWQTHDRSMFYDHFRLYIKK
jgi:hypothetical protein